MLHLKMVQTEILWQMLNMTEFDIESKKAIQQELKYRNYINDKENQTNEYN